MGLGLQRTPWSSAARNAFAPALKPVPGRGAHARVCKSFDSVVPGFRWLPDINLQLGIPEDVAIGDQETVAAWSASYYPKLLDKVSSYGLGFGEGFGYDHPRPERAVIYLRCFIQSIIDDDERQAEMRRRIQEDVIGMFNGVGVRRTDRDKAVDAGAIRELAELLRASSSEEVQELASEALSLMAASHSVEVADGCNGEGAISRLVELLGRESQAVQENAATLLTSVSKHYGNSGNSGGVTGAVPHLVRLLSSDSAAVQVKAVAALASIAPRPARYPGYRGSLAQYEEACTVAVPRLVQLLGSDSPAVQASAAAALGHLASWNCNEAAIEAEAARLIPALVALLESPSKDVKGSAAAALGNCSGNGDCVSRLVAAGALPALVTLLRAQDYELYKAQGRVRRPGTGRDNPKEVAAAAEADAELWSSTLSMQRVVNAIGQLAAADVDAGLAGSVHTLMDLLSPQFSALRYDVPRSAGRGVDPGDSEALQEVVASTLLSLAADERNISLRYRQRIRDRLEQLREPSSGATFGLGLIKLSWRVEDWIREEAERKQAEAERKREERRARRWAMGIYDDEEWKAWAPE